MMARIAFRRLAPVTASLVIHLGLAGALVLGSGWAPVDLPVIVAELVEPEAPFGPPRRVHTATGSVPDHARLAVDARGRGIVVWEDSTAVRRRILLRSIGEGGRNLGPVRTLSQELRALAPAVAVGPGRFLVAWHEEQFPATKTIVMQITAEENDR